MTPSTIITRGPPISAPPRRSQSASVVSNSSTIPDLVDVSHAGGICGGTAGDGTVGGLGTASPVLPRMLIKWSVVHHVQFDRWIATIHTATDPRLQHQQQPHRSGKSFFSSLGGVWGSSSGGGGGASSRRKDIVKSFASAYEAREYCLAHSPPLMRRRQDSPACYICETPFHAAGGSGGPSSRQSLAGRTSLTGTALGTGGGASRRGGFGTSASAVIHCRNCGVCVCPDCTVLWRASRLPTTYHTSPSRRTSHHNGGAGNGEALFRVCLSCDAISSSFLSALEAGNFEQVIDIYERGNINLRSMVAPFTVRDRYPVHSAVAGGNLSIVRWLIDVHACPTRHSNEENEAPLLDAHGHSVLDIAICLRHVDIICYLAKECGLSVKSASASRTFLLEAFHATLASRHLTWVPGTTNNGPLHRLRSLAQQQAQQQQSSNNDGNNNNNSNSNSNGSVNGTTTANTTATATGTGTPGNMSTASYMMMMGSGAAGTPTAEGPKPTKTDTADPLIPPTTALGRATSAPAMASSTMFFNAQGAPLAPLQTPNDANNLMTVIREYQQSVTQRYGQRQVGKGTTTTMTTATAGTAANSSSTPAPPSASAGKSGRRRRSNDFDTQPPLPASSVRMIPTSKNDLVEKRNQNEDDENQGVEVSTAPGNAANFDSNGDRSNGRASHRWSASRRNGEYDEDDNPDEDALGVIQEAFETSMEYGGIETQNGEDCLLCCEKRRNCVMIPCGHLVACMKCGIRLTTCPICGKNARPLQVFKS